MERLETGWNSGVLQIVSILNFLINLQCHYNVLQRIMMITCFQLSVEQILHIHTTMLFIQSLSKVHIYPSFHGIVLGTCTMYRIHLVLITWPMTNQITENTSHGCDTCEYLLHICSSRLAAPKTVVQKISNKPLQTPCTCNTLDHVLSYIQQSAKWSSKFCRFNILGRPLCNYFSTTESVQVQGKKDNFVLGGIHGVPLSAVHLT